MQRIPSLRINDLPQSPRPAAAVATNSHQVPWAHVYDIMNEGPRSLGQLAELANSRRRGMDRAVLCGGERFAALLLKPIVPDWLYTWLPPVVLCAGMTLGHVLDRVVPGLCVGVDGDLHTKATLLDAIHSGPAVVYVWKTMAALVRPCFDMACAAPDRAAFDRLCEDSTRMARSLEGRLARAAYAIDAADLATAAAALDLDVRALRTLLETETPDGVAERALDTCPTAALLPDARCAERRRYLGAFLRRRAALLATAERIGVQRPPDGVAADVVFVVLPAAQTSGSGTDAVRRRLEYRFALSEADVLSDCGIEVERPLEPHSDASSSVPQPPWLDNTDALDCWAVSRDVLSGADLVVEAGTVLRTRREAQHARAIRECTGAELKELHDAVAAVDAVLVGADRDCVANMAALGFDRLLRMHNERYPVRLTMAAFCRRYATLGQQMVHGACDIADDVCAPYSDSEALVGNTLVLLTRDTHDRLDTRLRDVGPGGAASVRLADALQRAAIESGRLRRAFHEEYAWLAVASESPLSRRTPRSCRGQSPSPTSSGAAHRDGAGHAAIEAFVMRVLCCAATMVRRSGGAPRWATVAVVRVMRALGWLELQVLETCANRVAARTEDGPARLERLVTLCEMAALCCLAIAQCTDKAELVRQCNAVVRTAVCHIGRIQGPREAHSLCCHMFDETAVAAGDRTTQSPRSALLTMSETIDMALLAASLHNVTDAYTANALANWVAQRSDRSATAVACIDWLVTAHATELSTRFARVMQVLNAFTTTRQRLQEHGSASLPLLHSQWIAEVAQNAIASVLRGVDACTVPPLDVASVPSASALRASTLTAEQLAAHCVASVPGEVQAVLFCGSV